MPKLDLYQCGGCKAIIADSGQGQQQIDDSSSTVVESCPGVSKRNPAQSDALGTYHALCCTQCKYELGRFYIKSEKLAVIKKFLIARDNVLVYQLDRPDGEDLAARVEALERLTCFLYDKQRSERGS